MICPGCGVKVERTKDGYCPKCGFDLELTEDPAPEARILGDLLEGDFDEPSLIVAEGTNSQGKVISYLFYTASKSLSPLAVPKMSGVDVTIPNTKTERLALMHINGKQTVSDIAKAIGISHDELAVALLNLREKRVIDLQGPSSYAIPAEDEFAESVHTVRTEAPDVVGEPVTTDPTPDVSDAPDTDSHQAADPSDEEPRTADDLRAQPVMLDDDVAVDDLEEVSAVMVADVPDLTSDLEDTTAAVPRLEPAPPTSREPEVSTMPTVQALQSQSPPPAPIIVRSEAKLPAAKLPALTKAPAPARDAPSVVTAAAAPASPPPPPAPVPKAPLTSPSVAVPSSYKPPVPEAMKPAAEVPRAKSIANVRVTPKPGETDIETRARRLYEQALVEKEAGDILSALNNVKLAFTFCPQNDHYKRTLLELQASGAVEAGKRPAGASKSRALYEQATQAERLGDIDKAQDLLEKALEISKEAMFYNRLGVIIAMRRKDYDRGRELIEKAVELAPRNDTYQHNLAKVLARAAAAEVAAKSKGEPKKSGGLLGFLKKS